MGLASHERVSLGLYETWSRMRDARDGAFIISGAAPCCFGNRTQSIHSGGRPDDGRDRLSTGQHERTGSQRLRGLAVQRYDIETFGSRGKDDSVKSWYQDTNRRGKGCAAHAPRACGSPERRARPRPLVVSRLDRLSRNVHFITGLMEHKCTSLLPHWSNCALGLRRSTVALIATQFVIP